jgi:hypothetical protein
MYLIHAAVCPPVDGLALPDGLTAWLRPLIRPEDSVEHLVVHADARPHPTLGLYLRAERLEAAEEQATRLCRRWLRDLALLRGWSLVHAQAPLVVPFYARLLYGADSEGPNGPGPLSSN